MISNLLMATGSQAPVSTVDMVDPFGDNSGVALYKFDGDATSECEIFRQVVNQTPWLLQYDFNETQSGDISGWSLCGSVPATDTAQTYTLMAKNKAYVINGGQKSVFVATVDAEGTLGAFSFHSTLPTAMTGSVFFVTHSRVYLYNSWSETINASYYAVIDEYGDLGAWTSGTAFPETLRDGSTFLHGGYVYVCGGHHSSTFTKTCRYAPINTDGTVGAWVATSSLPIYKTQGCVLITNRMVYLIGGNNITTQGGDTVTATFNQDGTLSAWTTVTSAPTGLGSAKIVATNSTAYYFGGITGANVPHASCYKAPIGTDGILGAWSLMGTFPKTLVYYDMLITSSKIYLIGGKQDGVYSADIYSASFVGGINDYSDELVTQEPVNYSSTATNVTYGTGKFGNCAVFNGSSSYVDISSISYTNDITVSFWATNLATTTTYGRRFFDFGSNGIFCCLYLPQTNKIHFAVYDGSWREFTVACLLSNTFFTHICMTINPITGTKGYINGSLAGSMANNTIIKDYKTANKIGAERDASTLYGFPYHGSIDQFRIFNRALTQEEVTALYNESVDNYVPYIPSLGFFNDGTEVAHYKLDGDATDEIGNYDGTETSMAYVDDVERGAVAIFDGSTRRIITPQTINSSLPYSVSFFSKLNGSASTNYCYGLWQEVFAGGFTDFSEVGIFGDGAGNIVFRARHDLQSTTNTVSASLAYSATFNHYTAVYDGANISLYVNGFLAITAPCPAGHSIMDNQSIGGTSIYDGIYYYGSCLCSNVRHFNRALTATEVAALYNEGQ